MIPDRLDVQEAMTPELFDRAFGGFILFPKLVILKNVFACHRFDDLGTENKAVKLAPRKTPL